MRVSTRARVHIGECTYVEQQKPHEGGALPPPRSIIAAFVLIKISRGRVTEVLHGDYESAVFRLLQELCLLLAQWTLFLLIRKLWPSDSSTVTPANGGS